jgi:hypothetical protein
MELIEGAPLSAVCDKLQTRTASVTEVDLKTWEETLGAVCAEARQAEKPLSDWPADNRDRQETGRGHSEYPARTSRWRPISALPSRIARRTPQDTPVRHIPQTPSRTKSICFPPPAKRILLETQGDRPLGNSD